MIKKLPVIIAVLLIIALALGGWYYYKIFSFKSAMRSLSISNNQLMNDLIKLTRDLPQLNLAELTRKARENIRQRLAIMDKIRSLKPYRHKKQVDAYLRLLELENAYADSLIKLKQALIIAKAAEAGGLVKEEEVETVRQVGKKSIVYRKKIFSRDLTKFRSVMDTRLAALNRHTAVMRQLINYEIGNSKMLRKIVPQRNLMFQLEKANDQIK